MLSSKSKKGSGTTVSKYDLPTSTRQQIDDQNAKIMKDLGATITPLSQQGDGTQMDARLAHGGITEGNESSMDQARFLPYQSSEDAGFSLEDSLAHGSLNLQGQFEKHVKDQKDRGDSVVDSFFQYVLAHDPTELCNTPKVTAA